MLFAQHILTEWICDASVTQPPAPPVQVPDRLPVPFFDPELEGLCHRVRHTEREAFHRVEFVEPLDFKLGLRIGSTLLTKQFHLLLVDFVWSAETTGTPQRPSSRALILELDQWGQVITDGLFPIRDDPDGRQLARRVVVNIHNCKALDADVFVESDPVKVDDRRFASTS